MKLQEYCRHLGNLITNTENLNPDCEITAVANHSGKVQPGTLFCAIAGSHHDGHKYLADAVSKGASALVVHESYTGKLPQDIPIIRVKDSYFAWACLCESASGYPSRLLRVHAVTGTNGKTTTAFLLRHFLNTAEKQNCALFTTVICDPCEHGKIPEPASATMPDAETLQNLFLRCVQNGVRNVVMEASSHGLHQHRFGRGQFASGIFTNLTGDHLDYHKTMEAYYQAKKSLFTEMISPGAPVLINLDDPWGERLYRELETVPVQRLGLSKKQNAFCRILDFSLQESGTHACFSLAGQKYEIFHPLTGEHNLYNLLSALCIAFASGIPMTTLLEAARTAPPAPGRLEPFRLPSGAHAFVDYAHTDDALVRVLSALRALKQEKGRIITVFGCGGDRDRTKRPRMAAAAAAGSDMVIVTSDNPRSEDPEKIIDGILKGMPPAYPCLRIASRKEAIRKAVEIAQNTDLVLIAGKGHENYQEIQGIRYPFDDREQIRQLGGVPCSTHR